MQTLKQVLLLTVSVTVLWLFLYGKFSPIDWRTPVSYSGDDPQVLGWIKAAAQGDYLPFMPKRVARVGAPEPYANWHEFPMYAELEIPLLGLVARFSNIAVAANIGMLLARITTAIGFFIAAKHILKCSALWSGVCALAWASVYFHTYRGLGHLFLAFTWAVPLLVAASWRLNYLSTKAAFAIGVCGGLSNPYVAFMGGMLVLFANADHKRKAVAISGLMSAFLLCNADTLLFSNGYKMMRNYYESELYALKPLELILPPPGHLFGFLSAAYATKAAIRGEMFSPFLGLTGIAALVWMVKVRAPQLLQSVAVTASASIGGLGATMALCGLDMFRATNRWSLFIAAIALLWLVRYLSDLKLSGERTFYIALIICAASATEMLTTRTGKSQIVAYREDVKFGKDLEAAMPGAVLYCIPPMAFPDTPTVGSVQPYDMLRPWLHTSTVRFSAGAVRTKISEFDQNPNEQALRARGFTGMLIHRQFIRDASKAVVQSRDFVVIPL